MDVVAIQKDFQAVNDMALVHAQHESAVRAVAHSVGYQLDATDPDLIQRDIASNMRRSVEACLEVGRGLVVLKTACGHGNFMARLDVLGIEARVAQKFMQSANKFGKAPTSALLKAAGTQNRLFEMLVLDDEQVEELELNGQTGELSLDDVARMSVKELRSKLREARAEKLAVEKVLERKNKENDKLQLMQVAPPDEQFQEIMKKASSITTDALGAVRGGVRAALLAINDAPDAPHKAVFMAGLVGQLQAELNAMREEFNLPDVSSAAQAQLASDVAQWAGN
jgi:hypothetical protein